MYSTFDLTPHMIIEKKDYSQYTVFLLLLKLVFHVWSRQVKSVPKTWSTLVRSACQNDIFSPPCLKAGLMKLQVSGSLTVPLDSQWSQLFRVMLNTTNVTYAPTVY